jgi:ATPase subunit of ABC transporter with duplicated ATPase domains
MLLNRNKPATSRKKALDKLNLEDMRPSSRRYPFINWKPEREPGNEIFRCDGLGKKDINGEWLFKDISFSFNKGDKIAFVCRNQNALTAFFEVMAGVQTADTGTFEFGQTIKMEYTPNDNTPFFEKVNDQNLVDWLRQYSKEKEETFIRGFLGRMLFSGEEVFKGASVLSGGEKVRCMFSKSMLGAPNFLILDEPTNHLDLESITALNNAMTDFPGNMIFTSHDFQIMDTVGNRVVEISATGMIDQLMTFGDYIKSDKVKNLRAEIYGDLVEG